MLDDKFGMCITDGLNLLFNLNNPHVFVKNAIYFNPDEENEIYIEFNNDKQLKKELTNFLNVFTLTNLQNIKDYIKHNYSQHLPDSKKANLGKYYTPKKIVELLKTEIESEITDNTYVMDLACGCGAFLELFNDCHIVGRDVDNQAIEILELFNFENIAVDNSLLNVSRNKYHLSENDDLVIIGNPPYNDSSSINKRYSTKSKAKRFPEDSDIHCRDIGRSFLEAYAKLKPRSICVLHPLSYLIKKVNFKSLKRLSKNYKLISATIFSSDEFEDLKGGSVFPIIIARYDLCDEGMNYDYIKNFRFNILDSDKKFTLANVEQTGHDYIHQTVTSVDVNNNSDIDLYHYNFRD
nr:N-6 DNA methylase [Treponema socranskii]